MKKRRHILAALLSGVFTGFVALGLLPSGVQAAEIPAVADFTGEQQESEEQNTVSRQSFEDVQEGRYFYRPVYWALENNITYGTSPTTFSPDNYCTRAQTVSFLWRMAGEPEPANIQTGFTDVPEYSYYAKAVAWAVENQITFGKSPTTFDPEGVCTRAEFVAFLYRSTGALAPQNTRTRFVDVEDWRYYATPIAWAVENGVTVGTSPTTFSPNETCTRGQVVTFLHRWCTTLNVRDCGAIANDAIDDTDAINQAIEKAAAEAKVEAVYIPAGVYVIDAKKSIQMKSNTNLLMDAETLLDVTGNALEGYSVIHLENVENISISGGQIGGERYKHTGSGGEWGMGIRMHDSRNIRISNMSIARNWGDGIYLGTTNHTDEWYGCENIVIQNCRIYDNRRSNISIVDANQVVIDGCTITDANGAAPQCGINIEPNRDDSGSIPADAICKDITISNTTINVRGKGDYWGQFFCFMTMNYPDNSIITAENIRIANCTFNGDCGNYSGANVSISDTLIGGTFYDEQNTELNNVSYEDIWRG